MAETPETTPEFDPTRLDAFLRGAIPGLAGTMALQRIAGGQSNPTFFVGYANRRLVLRKKPPGVTLPSAHAVDREARVLRALAPSAVPVPGVVLFHADPDVVGTPFYVMDRVEGRVFGSCDLPGASAGERRGMYLAFAETLAALHDVDWQAAGLEGFGRPGNYFERQVGRWTRQWEQQRFRDIPELKALGDRVAAHIPPDDGEAAIVHGDYRPGNVMFAPQGPGIVAVLDWELSTIGHPLADLAFSVIAWRSAPAEYGGMLGLDIGALGIPSEAEYVAHYYASRKRPAPRLEPFHVAFAMFRFAVIFEGIAARARAGNAASADAASVGELSVAFARRGLDSIGA